MADMFADYKKEMVEKTTLTPKKEKADAPPPTSGGHGNFEYLYRGAFTMLKVNLSAGEKLKAESDAMVAMSANVAVEGKLEGGVLGGLGRMLSGEKFFFQTLIAQNGPGEVCLSPSMPGDIMDIELDGMTSYILQKDGFFAGDEGVNITTKMQNLAQGFLSGEGFFVIRAGGRGRLFISSYGAIHPIDLSPGEEIVVDNYHLVAWPETMDYHIEKASSGWISSFTSGEGLVCRFRGPGRILIQTRNPQAFAAWLRQIMPSR